MSIFIISYQYSLAVRGLRPLLSPIGWTFLASIAQSIIRNHFSGFLSKLLRTLRQAVRFMFWNTDGMYHSYL
jgi:hypothetical protein